MADYMDNYDFIYTHIKSLKAKLAATMFGIAVRCCAYVAFYLTSAVAAF